MKNKLFRYILHILYPTRCPVCGTFIDYNGCFCKECADKLTRCITEFSVSGSDGSCASFMYDENIIPAIMLLKDGICGNADFALGSALAAAIGESEFANKIDVIIPVPLHKKDKRIRGYNQSELIANVISDKLGFPVCSDAVKKIKRTKSQKLLSESKRKNNLHGAFAVADSELVRNKRILLVDDVCTTGSTLAEITSLLKENGAAEVYCAVCCKTGLNSSN